MDARLLQAMREGDPDATHALRRLAVRRGDVELLARALVAMHRVSPVQACAWLLSAEAGGLSFASDPARDSWSPTQRLSAEVWQYDPTLAANVQDLWGDDAPCVLILSGTLVLEYVKSPPRAESSGFEVELPCAFVMDRTPVTQARWSEYVDHNPSTDQGARLPVVNVLIRDAITYCNALSRARRLPEAYDLSELRLSDVIGDNGHVHGGWDTPARGGYRLPGEVEWEYACRAGMATDEGEEAVELDATAWFAENAEGRTHQVGAKKPNAWGLHDMIGNVAEWCLAFEDPRDPSRARDSIGLHCGPTLERGGSYRDDARWLGPANRVGRKGRHPSPTLGFRCVRTVG